MSHLRIIGAVSNRRKRFTFRHGQTNAFSNFCCTLRSSTIFLPTVRRCPEQSPQHFAYQIILHIVFERRIVEHCRFRLSYCVSITADEVKCVRCDRQYFIDAKGNAN